MRELVDKHAPEKEKVVIVRPKVPWYNANIDDAKRSRRRMEHRWLKSHLSVDHARYKEQCQVVNNMIMESKKGYYNTNIEETLVIKKLFLTELSNRFADFFLCLKLRKSVTKFRTPRVGPP